MTPSNWRDLLNKRLRMDGLQLMQEIANGCIRVTFFDPQYRGVLDKLHYGNEGKERGKGRAALPQMTEEVIKSFLREIQRVLCHSGYLFFWVDKFHLIQSVNTWVDELDELQVVDMITWDKKRIGMGYRTRRRSEYLVVIQKQPIRAKATWSLHNIPDAWEEKLSTKPHEHSKPIGLQQQLILATTHEGDIVLDPSAGGWSVLSACVNANRDFIGCDLVYGDED